MKLLTISNLYPRPDQPQRGLFNAQLFEAMAKEIGSQNPESRIQNICFVPEWRLWRWPEIARWCNQCSVFSKQNPELSIRTVYLPVFYIPFIGRSLSWWLYLQALKNLEEQMLECDVVFSTWLYPDGVAATMMAHACGRRSWIMVQGSDAFHLENASRRRVVLDACTKAEGVVCVCKSLVDRLIDAGVESAKVHVVPNGVNGELFRCRTKEEAVKQLSVSSYQLLANGRQQSGKKEQRTNNQCRIILFVGNLVNVKGSDIMLEAFGRVAHSHQSSLQPATSNQSLIRNNQKQLKLLLVGDGPMRGDLERKAKELGIADSVFFLGSRPHEEVALWMNAADCLCLPSRNEGMPNVVIEALASGLPVVAMDVGGVSELLENEPGARIVMEGGRGDVEGDKSLVADFATAINDILKTSHDRKAMADRSKGWFSWDNQAETILKMMGKD
ncbi:MAG: hypothetical protein A2283_17115 [Lentisphaerae bacterium RIFOXYA12_FULL_48_11]|nr:MAG: hypothetical protein A2283_17115 [Lentisphaerae bacterium RIFOXYA12_FULL_48_11]